MLDTMELAEKVICDDKLDVLQSYKLGDLFAYVTGEQLSDAHRTRVDVNATIAILTHYPFWKHHKENMKPLVLLTPASVNEAVDDDSDSTD